MWCQLHLLQKKLKRKNDEKPRKGGCIGTRAALCIAKIKTEIAIEQFAPFNRRHNNKALLYLFLLFKVKHFDLLFKFFSGILCFSCHMIGFLIKLLLT